MLVLLLRYLKKQSRVLILETRDGEAFQLVKV